MTIHLWLLLRNNFASISFFPSIFLYFIIVVAFCFDESNVNRVHKEKLLPSIVIMHINAMVDTPRHYDYVCVWVSSRSSFFSLLSFLSFLLRIYCSEYIFRAQYTNDKQDLYFTSTWHNTLSSFFLPFFYARFHIIIYIQLRCSECIYTQHNAHHRYYEDINWFST